MLLERPTGEPRPNATPITPPIWGHFDARDVSADRWTNSEADVHKMKAALFLALFAFGMASSLTGCIIEDRDGGRHHERDWR
jgi:hypothetical protein